MSTSIAPPVTRTGTDQTWLRLVQISIAIGCVALPVFAYVGTFLTTVSEGDFRYTADYWYTAVGLPLAVVGIGHTLGVHRLQHGADGRRGTIGVWVNAVALIVLFVQLSASLVAGSELRWGGTYLVCTFLSFVGITLLAAGSWRVGLLPTWMLGGWPVAWVLGTFLAQGPMPLALAAFLVVLGVRVTRQVHQRQADPLPS